jgi:hypothetical protein
VRPHGTDSANWCVQICLLHGNRCMHSLYSFCYVRMHFLLWLPGFKVLCLFKVGHDTCREFLKTVWIHVRIGPKHPLTCRKRQLNGVVLRIRPENQDSLSQ